MNQNPLSNVPSWSNRQVVVATLFVVIVVVSFFLIYQLRAVIFIFFVSIVLGTAIRPAVDWLSRRGAPRSVGVILIFLIALLLLTGFVILVVPLIADQVTELTAELPDYYSSFRQAVFQSPSRVLQRLVVQLPPDLNLANLEEQAPEVEVITQVAQTFEYAGLGARVFLVALAVLLLAFYWTQESERSIRSILLFFPSGRREEMRELLAGIEAKVGGYIRGQSLLCLSIGVLALIAYLLIGMPYALVLAIIAGVMEAVPVFGPALGAIPAILVALSTAPDKIVWILIATAVIQALENYLLVPRVMNRSVGVNPFVTLLSLAAFSSLLGLPGALLAIPMAAIIQLLLDRFIWTADRMENQQEIGRDYASLLRYEAQSLSQDIRKQTRVRPTGPDADKEPGDEPVGETIEAIANELDRLLAQVTEKEGQLQ
jgi:predicted PurR-regulated permease PerM